MKKQGFDAIRLKLIALAIDTEGSISFNLFKKKGYPKPYLQIVPLVLVFSNMNADLYYYIKNLCSLEFPDITFRDQISQDTYRLNVDGSNKIRKLLTALLPYLIAKRDNAETVLNWLESRSNHYEYTREEIDMALGIRKRPPKPWAIEYLTQRRLYG